MSIMDNKGLIFSMDLLVAFLVLLAMLHLTLLYSYDWKSAQLAEAKQQQLRKNAIFIADAMVKNNAENAMLGAALFDGERHRVLENNLDVGRLRNIQAWENAEVYVAHVSVKWKQGGYSMFLENDASGNCAFILRFVLADNKKALLRVGVCEK